MLAGFGSFFNFNRTRAVAPEPLPASHSRDARRSGEMVWMSREDIYSTGNRSVLLLRAGQRVERALLTKLLNHGAHPSQFVLTMDTPEEEPPVQIADETDVATNPIVRPRPVGTPVSWGDSRALILESDERSFKKMFDCLVECGFSADGVHGVLVPENIDWYMGKYQPALLVTDFALGPERLGLRRMTAIREHPGIQKLIITARFDPGRESRQPAFYDMARMLGADALKKPVHRQAVINLLQSAPGGSASPSSTPVGNS